MKHCIIKLFSYQIIKYVCTGKYNVLHFISSVLEATKVNNEKVIELLVAVPRSAS